MVFKRSVNVSKFKIFLEELRSAWPFDDMLLCMDNLSVHRNVEVRERMEELGFRWCFTPRYSPAYNGIEEVFSLAKRDIKRRRL